MKRGDVWWVDLPASAGRSRSTRNGDPSYPEDRALWVGNQILFDG